ncbi:MAG: metalloregulator ArsR/SmtB family transcription factor [Gemmatimonadota bacterium]
MRASKPMSPADPQAGSDLCEVQCVDEVKVRRARNEMKPAPTLAALAETFKVLGDPTRLSIVWALSREELCVCDLANVLGMSQSAVSHSLRALRQLRLVRYRKAGKIAYYTLDDAHIAHLLEEGVRHVEEAP